MTDMKKVERSLKRAAIIAFGMFTLSSGMQARADGIGEKILKKYEKIVKPIDDKKRDLEWGVEKQRRKVAKVGRDIEWQKRNIGWVADDIGERVETVRNVVGFIGSVTKSRKELKYEGDRQESAQVQQEVQAQSQANHEQYAAENRTLSTQERVAAAKAKGQTVKTQARELRETGTIQTSATQQDSRVTQTPQKQTQKKSGGLKIIRSAGKHLR